MRSPLPTVQPLAVLLALLAAPSLVAGGRDVPGGPDSARPASERAEDPKPVVTVTPMPAPATEPATELGGTVLLDLEPTTPAEEGGWTAPEPHGRPRLERRVLPPAEGLPAPRISSTGTIPLSLQQVVNLAVAHHLDLHGSRIERASADARVDQQRGPFDPVLTGLYQYTRDLSPSSYVFDLSLRESTADVYRTGLTQRLWYGASYEIGLEAVRSEANTSTLSPSYATDVSLRYTQPLLRGFGRDANRAAIAQAINSQEVARLNLVTRARDIARDAVRGYWELTFALRDLEVHRTSLRLAQELLRKNRIMVEVGTLAPLEIAQAEASVAEREFRIIQAEKAVGQAQDNLRQLIGVTGETAWWNASIEPLDEPAFSALTASLEEEIGTALARRDEVAVAQLSVANAKLGVAVAKDALLPQLNFDLSSTRPGLSGVSAASYTDENPYIDSDGDGDPTNDRDLEIPASSGNMRESFGQSFGRDYESWVATLTYSQPLRNRAAEGDYLVQRLALEDARLAATQLEQSIVLEVRKAVRDLDSARESVLSARATRDLQVKTLDAEVKKFENGLSTNFEVLQFQNDLQTAESAELRALTNYLEAQADLKRARGTLLQDFGLQAAK